MGCSGSNVQERVTQMSPGNPYYNQYLDYCARNEKLEQFCQEILDDCIKRHIMRSNSIAKITNEISSIKGGTGPLTPKDFLCSVSDLTMQQTLWSQGVIGDVDIEKTIDALIISRNDFKSFSAKDVELWISSIVLKYPRVQTSIMWNQTPSKALDDKQLIESFYMNLKFNKTFLVNCCVLEFGLAEIEDSEFCNSLPQILECNSELRTWIIKLKKQIDNELLSHLDKLFQTISTLTKLQCLVVMCEEDEWWKLTKIQEGSIVEWMSKENKLVVFGWIKVELSTEFIKEMGMEISKCNELKVLCLESKTSDPAPLDYVVGKGIGRSSSIIVVCFAGFELSEEKITEYEQMKQRRNNFGVKVFEYRREWIVKF